jgi:hypothetical protein
MRRALLLLLVSCAKTRADVGRDALLSVRDAQFYREAMPDDTSGPRVVSAVTGGVARAGEVDQGVTGDLEHDATAVAIELAGDVGYWVVPAKLASVAAPNEPTFQATFGVARDAPIGPRQIVLRAVDGDGRFGPPLLRPLAIAGALAPVGRLVVSLTWQNGADLDLHVVLPSGIELYKRNRTEFQHPAGGAPVPPGTPLDGGVLDRDSNASCVFDGKETEDAVWTEAPPKGHYVVRVDTFSLCGEPSAPWRLEAILDGQLVGAAQGVATDADLRFGHDRGSGVLALELDVP